MSNALPRRADGMAEAVPPSPHWHCRIGKITRKDGRGSVRVLRLGDDFAPGAAVLAQFDEYGAQIREAFAKDHDAAGFVIVMWDRGLRFTRARHIARGSLIGGRLIPDLVAGILRQDAVADIARGVMCGDE